MLKFQDDYTTIVTNFEDFILPVYVLIDDLYRQFVSESVSHRRNCHAAKLSDFEIITISIRGNLLASTLKTPGILSQKRITAICSLIFAAGSVLTVPEETSCR